MNKNLINNHGKRKTYRRDTSGTEGTLTWVTTVAMLIFQWIDWVTTLLARPTKLLQRMREGKKIWSLDQKNPSNKSIFGQMEAGKIERSMRLSGGKPTQRQKKLDDLKVNEKLGTNVSPLPKKRKWKKGKDSSLGKCGAKTHAAAAMANHLMQEKLGGSVSQYAVHGDA